MNFDKNTQDIDKKKKTFLVEGIDSDFDFSDDIFMKPLTEGLGFHHSQERPSLPSYEQIKANNREIDKDAVLRSGEGEVFEGLKAFYQREQSQTERLPNMPKGALRVKGIRENKLSQTHKKVGLLERVEIFLFDFFILLSIKLVLSLAFMMGVEGRSIGEFKRFLFLNINHLSILIPIFLLLLFFYLSFFNSQKLGTPGAQIVGVNITGESNLRLGFVISSLRTLFLFFSGLLFFIPIMLGYQNKFFKINLRKMA